MSARTDDRHERDANREQPGDAEVVHEPCSDAQFVQETLGGERQAFDRLVERYQRRASTVAFRLLGDIHDALEVCQEAFIRAYRNLETLEHPERFGSWLMRIVTNLSLNYRRDRAAGGRKISFDDCLAQDERQGEERFSQASVQAPPSAELDAAETRERVGQAIAALPSRQRTALVLFSIEQLPQRQVAGIMACSVEAVKWHVFQARRKLKEHLAETI